MRLEIRYVTEFDYAQPVRESHNELRACPAITALQRLESYQVTIDPPARIHTFLDYWGTRVDAFGLRSEHDRLTVAADSVVVTEAPEPPSDGVPRARLDAGFRLAHAQFLQPTAHTNWTNEIMAAAEDLAAGTDGVAELAERVAAGVNEHLEYAPGTTYVGVDLAEVFAARKGVCQDYAHLALAMYRSLGLPARYVSGYFYATDQSVADEPEPAEIEVQTHAWVEVAVPGHGWWALDPTNGMRAGARHVKIGHGRDYDDVLPLRGVFHGPPDHDLGVSVRMTREEMPSFAQ